MPGFFIGDEAASGRRISIFSSSCFTSGPLVVENAVVDAVSIASVPHEEMLAQNAFLFRADAQHRLARRRVEHVGLELDSHATKLLERVRQHQVLRLGVDRGPLPRTRDPGPADLDAAICGIVVAEPRAADDTSGAALDCHEGQSRAVALELERVFHVAAHLVGRLNHRQGIAPDLGIESDFREPGVMIERHRLEPHEIPFEHDRLEWPSSPRHSPLAAGGAGGVSGTTGCFRWKPVAS